MKSSVITSLLLLAVATKADEKGYQVKFTATSVKSHIFAPLRANKTMALINECGKEVTEPLGILEQTFKQGLVKNGEQCTWKLHAPANHVVNVISLIFIMEDEIKPSRSDDVKTSVISLYDGPKVEQNKWLISYVISPQEKVGHFVSSLSSGQDMVIEIKYHDNKDFATQRVLINYEFLEYEKMIEALRTYKP